jgi:hypothetical protein
VLIRQQSEQCERCAGLPASGFAHQAQNLASRDLETHARDRLTQLRVSAAVRDAEVPHLEEVCDQLEVPFRCSDCQSQECVSVDTKSRGLIRECRTNAIGAVQSETDC